MKLTVAAVDGSPMSLVALHYGAEIAKRLGAKIRAVYVEDQKLLGTGLLAEAPVHDQLETALEAEAKETLYRASDRVARLGMPLETRSRRGVVPLVLCEEAEDADLITMGRWGEHAIWATGMLGSAVECVVRKVGKPVLVASSAYQQPKRVLVPYDGSTGSEKALGWGAELAGAFEVPLVLQTVNLNEEAAAELLDAATSKAREIRADLTIERLSYHGDRSAEIASEAGPDTLTCMGAYGHSPLRELILGSVTAQVMRLAKGPLLLCR
ncbi:MAG: universal stress protein [Planctomycetota bacterium]|jgi:nucleotide-binding universal stress UspA family protein